MMRRALVPLVLTLLSMPAAAGVIEVTLKLPVKPKLAISADDKILVAPFIISTNEAAGRRNRSTKVDVQTEFSRYFKKQITKTTKLKVVDSPASVVLPSNDFAELAQNRDFWRDLAAKTGADYVVSGVIDFDIEDRAGYKTEEYISPVDGRTYYRQLLVENSGFVFDIVISVFDGETGEKKIEENFRDFKEFEQADYDEILGLFENLRSLEAQLLGIFVSQETAGSRFLFTN